jgi:hypothetical protein
MHSAAFGAQAAVIRVMLTLSPDEAQDVDLAARNGAYFRNVAGVHYPQDNRVGLWLGGETVRRALPAKLAAIGYDQVEVEQILTDTVFDWSMV